MNLQSAETEVSLMSEETFLPLKTLIQVNRMLFWQFMVSNITKEFVKSICHTSHDDVLYKLKRLLWGL